MVHRLLIAALRRPPQAKLWLVDGDEYYNGKYIKVSDAHATLPYKPMDARVCVLLPFSSPLTLPPSTATTNIAK